MAAYAPLTTSWANIGAPWYLVKVLLACYAVAVKRAVVCKPIRGFGFGDAGGWMVPDAMSNHAVITLIDGAEALDAGASTYSLMDEIFPGPTSFTRVYH